MSPCCSCNRHNAKCKRCVCACAGGPCSSCLPMQYKNCVNLLNTHVAAQSGASVVGGVTDSHVAVTVGGPVTGEMVVNRKEQSDGSAGISSNLEMPRYDYCLNVNAGTSEATSEATCTDVDAMIYRAYGMPLLWSAGTARDSSWHQCWLTIVYHVGRHYSLPGGSVGKKYIDLLNQELQLVVSGSYSDEWVIVLALSCCSVIGW